MKSFYKVLMVCVMVVSPAFCVLSNVLLSGDVLFRIMDDRISLTTKKGGNDSTVTNETYLNYAWNFKAVLTSSEFLRFGFRLSNPYGAVGEKVSSNMTWINKGGYRALSIPEAYFLWTMNKFSITGGIIPVLSTTLMNFVLYEGVGFKEVGRSPWSALMNNSQQGMMVELVAFEDVPKAVINVQLMISVAADAGADTNAIATDNMLKEDQWRFILQSPMDFLGKRLLVNPGISLRTNVGRNKKGDEGSIALASGVSLEYKVLPDLQSRAGFAIGGFDNRALGIADSVAPLSMLVDYGLTFKTPLGTLVLDGNYSNWKDRSVKEASTGNPILYSQLHGDFKFGYSIKGLTIMPRMRLWYNYNDTNEVTKLQVRPELQFKAAFK